MLRPYFWAHVEQCSEVTPVDVAAEAELNGILLASQVSGKGISSANAAPLEPRSIDDMTGIGSRHLAPFSSEECQRFADALQAVRGEHPSLSLEE